MTESVGPSVNPIRLVVGLGNPGVTYGFNRHNVGFMTLDRWVHEIESIFEPYGALGLTHRGRANDATYFLLKPLTYMNRSGRAVGELMDRYEISPQNTLVVSDDFQLPLGRLRFRKQGSHGGHNGLRSIIRTLGTESFPRLRIGIGPAPRTMDVADFVLSDFEEKDLKSLQSILERATQGCQAWVKTGDIDYCMNRYNKKVPETDPEETK